MKSLFSWLSFDATNFLCYMTLDVEQLHSSSHIKHPLLSKKKYCRDLWNTKKESTKRLSSSKVYYYTGEKNSWYPDPEHEIHLATLPSIPRLPAAKLSEKAVEEMRNYTSTYGAAVRQTTNRQETTMARHRTMSEIFSQRKLHISEDRVDLALFEGSDSSVVNENEEEVETAESDLENGRRSRVRLKYRQRQGTRRWRFTHSWTWPTVHFPIRNHYTLWTTTQDLQKISNVKVNLSVNS